MPSLVEMYYNKEKSFCTTVFTDVKVNKEKEQKLVSHVDELPSSYKRIDARAYKAIEPQQTALRIEREEWMIDNEVN